MDLLKLLNEDLALEYAAAIQYYQHAAVIDGLHAAFAGELIVHAKDEIGHAEALSNHIDFLGGIPGVKVGEIFTASQGPAMLTQDLIGETEAITRYKERIAQVRAAGDFGTEAILLDILADEEHHAHDVKTWLGR